MVKKPKSSKIEKKEGERDASGNLLMRVKRTSDSRKNTKLKSKRVKTGKRLDCNEKQKFKLKEIFVNQGEIRDGKSWKS